MDNSTYHWKSAGYKLGWVIVQMYVVTLTLHCSQAKIHASTTDTTGPASNCHVDLGVANPGLIPLYWLHASDGFAYRGRLDRADAWISDSPLYSNTVSQEPGQYAWIQVDLRRPTLVTGIQTQGDPLDDNWVTWYHVYHSRDCEGFQPVSDSSGYILHFHGNTDQGTVNNIILPDPIVARCIRIVPTDRHGNKTALRLEILGCDVRMCREAVITHLEADINFGDATSLSMIAKWNNSTPPRQGANQNGNKITAPTLMKRGYAEFKFSAEHIVFGLVVYKANSDNTGQSERFMLTYSRNCHHWEAVRESKWVGDPLVFSAKENHYPMSWLHLPYPIRAQCIRLIPVSAQYTAHTPIQAHFIGCGTGQGSSEQCGVRRNVRHRVKRVIGGTVTSAGEWPWLVSLQLAETPGDFYHICGASLVHPRWLLTALHCVNIMFSRLSEAKNATFDGFEDVSFLSSIRVLLGKHSLASSEDTSLEATVDKIVAHPDFNLTYYTHDVAMIKLSHNVPLSDHVGLACTPRTANELANQDNCRVIGWGKTGPGDLPSRPHQVNVRLFEFEECQAIFTHLNLTNDMLCAGQLDGSADACFGDSGGPMMCEHGGRWYQMGIVSWNIGCALEGFPGVYSSVPEHLDWIESAMKQEARHPRGVDPL